ncbi:response regulator [Arcobacter sp. F155]|uniref:response regulator n=1 Tax=Arcobacter sp. F155 TaxID=2044512 RepID=UPI00100A31A7|nr:response regulator [Arcobacter sp. F155]RXJ77659.1 response regulator [Arcobacter sp. F155]
MKKIAIIDDETSILDILERFLSRKNLFEIDTFENPLTALDSIQKKNYDLILCDIMMPQMNGIELVKKIKKIRPTQKIIMITAFSTEDKMIECDGIGVDDYLTKPFISMRDVENKVLDAINL